MVGRRPIGDQAMSGAERIARYRERQRELGRVMVWQSATDEPTVPAVDARDPVALLRHWATAIKYLRAVHRAILRFDKAIEQKGAREHARWFEIEKAFDDARAFDISVLNTAQPRMSRAARWQSAVNELRELIDEYQQWLDNLPDAIRTAGTPLVEKLEAVIDIDLSGLEDVQLPVGWGRD